MRRPRAASRWSGASRPFSTRPSRLRRIPWSPRSSRPWSASTTVVAYPDWATTWAMPPPISPHPTTPTFEIVIRLSLPPRGRPTGVRRCRGRAAARADVRSRHRARQALHRARGASRRSARPGGASAAPRSGPPSPARSPGAARSGARPGAAPPPGPWLSTFEKSRGSCSSSPARSSSATRMSASRRMASRAKSPRRVSSRSTCSGLSPSSVRWCSMIVMSGRSAGCADECSHRSAHRARRAAPLDLLGQLGAEASEASRQLVDQPARLLEGAGGGARPGGHDDGGRRHGHENGEHHRSHASLPAFPAPPVTRR